MVTRGQWGDTESICSSLPFSGRCSFCSLNLVALTCRSCERCQCSFSISSLGCHRSGLEFDNMGKMEYSSTVDGRSNGRSNVHQTHNSTHQLRAFLHSKPFLACICCSSRSHDLHNSDSSSWLQT